MTRRSGLRQWYLETRAAAMSWVAGKLFTHKQTGLDGVIKRAMLKPRGSGTKR